MQYNYDWEAFSDMKTFTDTTACLSATPVNYHQFAQAIIRT